MNDFEKHSKCCIQNILHIIFPCFVSSSDYRINWHNCIKLHGYGNKISGAEVFTQGWIVQTPIQIVTGRWNSESSVSQQITNGRCSANHRICWQFERQKCRILQIWLFFVSVTQLFISWLKCGFLCIHDSKYAFMKYKICIYFAFKICKIALICLKLAKYAGICNFPFSGKTKNWYKYLIKWLAYFWTEYFGKYFCWNRYYYENETSSACV